MLNKKQNIGIFLIVVLFIGGIYLVVSDHKGSENASEETSTSYVSNDAGTSNVPPESEVEINLLKNSKGLVSSGTTSRVTAGVMLPPEEMPNIKVSFNKIPHNAKPAFKVGDRFEYLSVISVMPTKSKSIQTINEENISEGSTLQTQEKSICDVINKERLKGKEYFVVKCIGKVVVMGIIREERDVYFISPENGEIKKAVHNENVFYKNVKKTVNSFSSEIPSPNSEIYGAGFYSPWMLSLSDDFKMKIKVFQHPTVAREEIAVIGEEKIKNRECYLVEYRQINKNNKVLVRKKEWIDKKKRIVIKLEGYHGNLRVVSTELVSNIN